MAYKYSKGTRGFGDITFEDDSDTGIDFETDTVKLETGGTERLVVTNSGVGIGISSPTSPLHVYGNLDGTYVATIDNDQNSNAHVLKLLTDGNGSNTRVLEMEDGDGDIIFRARADGRFGFGPDGVDSMGAGTFVVGIDNSSHTSDIAISKRLQHLGDSDTYLDFPANDQLLITVGNMEMVRMIENGGSSEITFNDGASANLDFVIKGDTNNPLFHTDAANNRIGIGGVGSPSHTLEVGGDIGINEKLIHNGDTNTYLAFTGQNEINLVANGYSFLKYDGNIKINNANRDRDTQIMADDGNVILHVDAGTNKVGIGATSPNSTLSVNGSLSLPITAKTSDYTATGSDYTILLNASSNNVTITLPAVSGITGRIYVLKRADGSGNTATVASNGSETIDNSTANIILSSGQSVTLQTDGTGWHKIAEYIQP